MAADPRRSGSFAPRVGLLGHPLEHSLSPAMQNAAFAAAGLPARYELLDVPPEDLPARLAALRAGGWLGCNVTVPYKTAVVSGVDELRGDAAILGAVNTIVVEETRLVGHNTDVAGFGADLTNYLAFRQAPGAAIVLGAGGAARAVTWTLIQAGWDVAVLARRASQAADLAAALPPSRAVRPAAWAEARALLRQWRPALLVNCTPLGMWPAVDGDPLPASVRLPPDLLVYDLVYRPPQTRLLHRAAAAGCRVASGLGMLVAQGAIAFTLWTGLPAPRELMRRAAERALLAS